MLLFTHAAMLAHAPPPGHPESPARLQAVLDALDGLSLERRDAPPADRDALARAHPPAYVDALDAAFPGAGDGLTAIDGGDTFLSDGSREAAYRAAGAVVAAVDAVLAGEDDQAFCAVRPPGHHAEPAQAMGFCVFNNVVVGALHALEAHGLSRVAVIDFDVHHGNGTQARAMKEPRLFFASTHQSPLYPGTGRRDEVGPADNVLNAPLPPGADGALWRRVMEREVLPALDAFDPDLILVSAGFDAHAADPLAAMALDEDDFAWGAKALRAVALRRCKGRIVSTLEGGYDLPALARSAKAYVRALQRD
ncbi:MAG: histone deacetylase family protein [Hyphomonadaceae bacterium]|nr:histone deacetylase family protein [Hyphomonadaceae bacterium]